MEPKDPIPYSKEYMEQKWGSKEHKKQTIQSVSDWMINSKEKQIVYYKGHLAYDRCYSPDKMNLRKLANFMMDMDKTGKVALTQKKLCGLKNIGEKGEIVYLYIAQRRKHVQH